MRRELVPIEHLGVAADALGKGRDVPDFAFSGGTREVRNAATAFHTMRIRLRRSIQQRTEMLAGVSHDLRTPLTRMKLSLALLPESPETRELTDDVDDMQRMIEGYLAFARGEGDEDPVMSDLSEILEDVAAGARHGNANLDVSWQGDMNVELRPVAIKRCLTNLVSNAQRYASQIRIEAVRGRTTVEITVDDNGPGIPPEKYEDVFRPFFRLDESRNAATGGVGLGLSIARDVARSHGGDVTLAASPLGGLRVVVQNSAVSDAPGLAVRSACDRVKEILQREMSKTMSKTQLQFTHRPPSVAASRREARGAAQEPGSRPRLLRPHGHHPLSRVQGLARREASSRARRSRWIRRPPSCTTPRRSSRG